MALYTNHIIMADKLDFELIDESADQDDSTTETNEDTTSSEEDSKTSSEGNTSSTKSKKSNWKKMSKTMKDQAKLIAKLEAKLEWTSSANDDDDEWDYEDEEEGGFDKTEFRFFTIENPEAKEYSKQLESALNTYPNMSFEDALTLVKAKTPTESTSSNDFSSKSSNVKVRKRLADLTEEEALKLSNSKYLEYQRSKGKIR